MIWVEGTHSFAKIKKTGRTKDFISLYEMKHLYRKCYLKQKNNSNGPSYEMDQVMLRYQRRSGIKTLMFMAKTVDKARDAGTGRFIPIGEAKRRPSTTVIEKVKVGPIKRRK